MPPALMWVQISSSGGNLTGELQLICSSLCHSSGATCAGNIFDSCYYNSCSVLCCMPPESVSVKSFTVTSISNAVQIIWRRQQQDSHSHSFYTPHPSARHNTCKRSLRPTITAEAAFFWQVSWMSATFNLKGKKSSRWTKRKGLDPCLSLRTSHQAGTEKFVKHLSLKSPWTKIKYDQRWEKMVTM